MEATARLDLVSLMQTSGWSCVGAGSVGEMWANKDGRRVGLPYSLTPEKVEWADVLARVATAVGGPISALEERVARYRYDVTEFRVDGPDWTHTVPVEAGVNLFKTARQILRSSATTSRAPKAVIGSGYSDPGDRILQDARFGQTKEGSYIVPLMVPVATEAGSGAETQPELRQWADDHVFHATMESPARRATRTMAESLDALWTEVLRPEKAPGPSKVAELVMQGVSRELVSSLHDVVSQRAVKQFDAKFLWSEHPSLGRPSVRSEFQLPSGAAGLLSQVARSFKKTPTSKVETFSGVMVLLRHDASRSFGSLAIDTIRHSRPAEIYVPLLGKAAIDRALKWFANHETLVVQGEVNRESNRLQISKPMTLGPLGHAPLKLNI